MNPEQLVEEIHLPDEHSEEAGRIPEEYRARQRHLMEREADRINRLENLNEEEHIARRIQIANQALLEINPHETNLYTHLCDVCDGGIRSAIEPFEEFDTDIFCNHCVGNYLRNCEICQARFSLTNDEDDELSGIHYINPQSHISQYYCNPCKTQRFMECESCGDIIPNGREYLIDDEPYCLDCYEIHNEDSSNDSHNIPRPFSKKILDKFVSQSTPGAIVKSGRIFSAEIECIAPTNRILGKAGAEIASEFGFEYDGSIGSENGIEIQTPRLAGQAGEMALIELGGILSKLNFETRKSCGLHIHIDGGGGFITEKKSDTRNHNGRLLADLMRFYIIFEDVMLSFLPRSRRSNYFCKPIRSNFHLQEIDRCGSQYDLEKLWYRASNYERVRSEKSHAKNGTRYCGVNMHTLFSANHLEIRYHSGTINARKILEWVNLHVQVMDRVRKQVDADIFREASEILDLVEKTNFMLEFLKISKVSREYFMKRQLKFSDRKADVKEEDFTKMVNIIL